MHLAPETLAQACFFKVLIDHALAMFVVVLVAHELPNFLAQSHEGARGAQPECQFQVRAPRFDLQDVELQRVLVIT